MSCDNGSSLHLLVYILKLTIECLPLVSFSHMLHALCWKLASVGSNGIISIYDIHLRLLIMMSQYLVYGLNVS